jgi:hypothetical protein
MTTVEVAPPAASIRPPEPVHAAAPAKRRRPRPPWPTVLAVVFAIGYAWLGLHLLYAGGYEIGDALARTSMARSVVDSRDPHLAAIGFVWMPLPTFVQLPIVALLKPWDLAAAAGPISTAMFGGATIPVLVAITRRLGLRPAAQVALAVLYAANPVVIFYASSGMSETSSFFFFALMALSYLRWTQTRRTHHLALLGLASAGACLTRYEGYTLTACFAILVALQVPRGRRIASALFVGAPGAFVLAVWMATSKLLLRNATYFLDGMANASTPPDGAPWLPADKNLLTSFLYVVPLIFRAAPVLLVLAPLALADDLRTRARRRIRALWIGPTALIVGALTFPAAIVVLLARNQSWGNPRYFAPLILFATIVVAWLMREGSLVPRRWHGALAVGLAVGWLTGFVTMADPSVSAIEGEPHAVYEIFGLGLVSENEHRAYGQIDEWRDLVDDLDAQLTDDDLVAADTSVAYHANLFTRYPDRYVIPSDRDFGQLVAAPNDRITWLIQPRDDNRGFGTSVDVVLGLAPTGMRWELVHDYGVAKLHHLVPA